jgi:hypothetical protein
MSDPIKVFTVITLISLPTVMFGGYSLLRLLPTNRLDEFKQRYFRAGHAHAGVLLVLALVSLEILGRTKLGDGPRWTICLVLLVGVLAQSGGMFVHMVIGKPRRWSHGNTLTVVGAALLAIAMLWLAYGVIIT